METRNCKVLRANRVSDSAVYMYIGSQVRHARANSAVKFAVLISTY